MPRTLLLCLCVVFLCLASPQAQAVKGKSLYLGIGALSHNLMAVSQTGSGETSFLGPLYYPFLAQSYFKLGDNWFIGPTVGYTLFPRATPEGGEKTSFLLLNSPFLQHFGPGDMWDWSVGPGFVFYIIQGMGGTKVLDNGNSTATFAIPSRTQYASTISFNLGVGYTTGYVRLGVDTITEGIISSTRRSFSLMFYLTYNVLGGAL